MRILGMPVADAGTWRRLRRLGLVLLSIVGVLWFVMVRMPGRSWHGPLDPLTPTETGLRAQLESDVRHLAGPLADRGLMNPMVLAQAADWIEGRLAEAGCPVQRQVYRVDTDACANLVAELPGTTGGRRMFVVGAHYDAVSTTPGADDNATGVAALLALAQHFAGRPLPVTLRFVAFVNEEPPYFWTERMGSMVQARSLAREHAQVIGMWSLECLGYYRAEPHSQRYPGPAYANPLRLFYPDRGDFVTFVGNATSGHLVRASIGAWRRRVHYPSEGMAATSAIPGIGWSDHWSFQKAGYPALMVTDTAPFRNTNYHQPSDTPETLDFERMARVVAGLATVLSEVAR